MDGAGRALGQGLPGRLSLRTGRALSSLVVVALLLRAAPAAADPPCAVNALDCVAVGQFSATAAATSDALFVTSLALPVGLELGRGLDDDSLRRGLAYGGAVGVTAISAWLVKITVRRPRPYTHSREPGVLAFAQVAKGNDHSFFSGHTSIAFAAATSAGVLADATAIDARDRAARWAVGGALAAATGIFRIRAGRHFPTDVLVGAAVGSAAGIGVTLALTPGADLRWQDAAAFGGGVALGAVVAAVVPMPRDVVVPLGGRHGLRLDGPVAIAPLALPTGGVGLALSAQLR